MFSGEPTVSSLFDAGASAVTDFFGSMNPFGGDVAFKEKSKKGKKQFGNGGFFEQIGGLSANPVDDTTGTHNMRTTEFTTGGSSGATLTDHNMH